MKKTALLAALMVGWTTAIAAQQLTTLATLALEAPLRAIAAGFKTQTGHVVTLQLDSSPNIVKRLASGENPDVLIAVVATVDEAVKNGRAIGSSRARIGQVGIGVALSRGGKRLDIASAEALRIALVQADAVLYSQGASGLYVEQLFKKMGVADTLQAKMTRLGSGGEIMKRLGEGRGTELGFTMISEIKQGESLGGLLLGPLPGELQTYTAYDAVVMASAPNPDRARAFIQALTGPAARKLLAGTGWEF